MKILKKICKKKIFIVEDAAHSFGAKYSDGSLLVTVDTLILLYFHFIQLKQLQLEKVV